MCYNENQDKIRSNRSPQHRIHDNSQTPTACPSGTHYYLSSQSLVLQIRRSNRIAQHRSRPNPKVIAPAQQIIKLVPTQWARTLTRVTLKKPTRHPRHIIHPPPTKLKPHPREEKKRPAHIRISRVITKRTRYPAAQHPQRSPTHSLSLAAFMCAHGAEPSRGLDSDSRARAP